MKLYLGLTENSPPRQTRIFGEVNDKLIDLNLAYAAYLTQAHEDKAKAYELASFYFPHSIAAFLQRGESTLAALERVVSFLRPMSVGDYHGPAGEKVVYNPAEVRVLPPLQNPEKSIVIGFADRARIETMPKAEIPTGFYKLPSTFIASGESIVWPKFSEEVDGDACLAIVIGKPGKRISPEQAWDHIAGFTLLLDITARDINKREGRTSNNLLGKNFPSSTALGPALLLKNSTSDLEDLEIDLTIDGIVKQKFTPRECVFTIEQIIARWSLLGLKAGDVLAIGASMSIRSDKLQHPVPLTMGSAVRCSSPAIGELSHRVVSAERRRP